MNVSIEQALQLAIDAHRAGRLDHAEQIYRDILSAEPNHGDALHLLAHVLAQRGHPDQALPLASRALELHPSVAGYHHTLGNVFGALGRLDEAIKHLNRAHELNPSDPETLNNLANVLVLRGEHEQAFTHFRRLLELHPNLAAGHVNFSIALKSQGRLGEAVHHARLAIELQSDLPQARNALANALSSQGLHEQAEGAWRRALQLKPDYVLAHSNLLLAMHYDCDDPSQIFAEHKAWARQHAEPIHSNISAWKNSRDPRRRLRVGYVSRDFYEHVVSRFIEPVLEHHDRDQFEIFCYADVVKTDAVTQRIEARGVTFRRTTGLSNPQMAEMIRHDQIDLLIDLAGHTSGPRLLLFALRPAPVQLTWLGYPDTTGLKEMNYRITDAVADPPGLTEDLHAEQLLRLPTCAWCWRIPEAAPPAHHEDASTRPITFGCVNSLPKISRQTLNLFKQVLAGVPSSKMLIKAPGLEDEETRRQFEERLSAAKIPLDRVELLGKMRLYADHLATFHRIDIALDSFPYTGTTTTCEAMLMSTPLITLAGRTHVSRVSASLLTAMDLQEFVATSESEFVRIAVNLANDREHLAQLHETLRDRFITSPLTDGKTVTRNIEAAYRDAWTKWSERPN